MRKVLDNSESFILPDCWRCGDEAQVDCSFGVMCFRCEAAMPKDEPKGSGTLHCSTCGVSKPIEGEWDEYVTWCNECVAQDKHVPAEPAHTYVRVSFWGREIPAVVTDQNAEGEFKIKLCGHEWEEWVRPERVQPLMPLAIPQ